MKAGKQDEQGDAPAPGSKRIASTDGRPHVPPLALTEMPAHVGSAPASTPRPSARTTSEVGDLARKTVQGFQAMAKERDAAVERARKTSAELGAMKAALVAATARLPESATPRPGAEGATPRPKAAPTLDAIKDAVAARAANERRLKAALDESQARERAMLADQESANRAQVLLGELGDAEGIDRASNSMLEEAERRTIGRLAALDQTVVLPVEQEVPDDLVLRGGADLFSKRRPGRAASPAASDSSTSIVPEAEQVPPAAAANGGMTARALGAGAAAASRASSWVEWVTGRGKGDAKGEVPKRK